METSTKTQPATDGRTTQFMRQSADNRRVYERDALAREHFKQFFETCSDDRLEQLKAALLPTMDPKMAAMVRDKLPRDSKFLRRLIYIFALSNGLKASEA